MGAGEQAKHFFWGGGGQGVGRMELRKTLKGTREKDHWTFGAWT